MKLVEKYIHTAIDIPIKLTIKLKKDIGVHCKENLIIIFCKPI